MPPFAGLQTNFLTWLILAGVAGCWLLSARLVPGWRSVGWPALLKSVYGLVWLDFGLDILLRFLMLAWNAVAWGNGTLRLLTQTAGTVNRTLASCGLFWLLVSLAYKFAVRRKGSGPLGLARPITIEFAYAAAVPVTVLASVAFYLAEGHLVPLSLVTPMALLAGLYMVPATVVWWDHFRRSDPWWRIGSIQAVTLLPALVRGYCSPYRENFAPIFLIPLVAALFAGRRPSLRIALPAALICLLALSWLVQSYRQIKWENVRPAEIFREFSSSGPQGWLALATDEPSHRFHGFDSLLLTIHLVPEAKPYSRRNVLISPFIRAFVPRLIDSDKAAADAGQRFGAGIWAYEDPQERDRSGAAIAPSMPGDLYDAGGVLYIAMGALIWGAVLGLIDGWKAYLPTFSAAALTSLVATQCAMSVERDFDHELATFLQTFLVFLLVAGFVALARRREDEYGPQLSSGMDRA
jgi:hypothetical protein